MTCPNCGHDFPKDSVFCNRCGTNLSAPPTPPAETPPAAPVPPAEIPPAAPAPAKKALLKKLLPKKLLFIGGGALAAIAAVVVLLALLIPSAQEKFFKAIDGGKPEEAVAVYSESILGDAKAVSATIKAAVAKLEKARDLFFSGKSTYEEARAELEKYEDIPVSAIADRLGGILAEVDALNGSNLAYAAGQTHELDGDLASAILEFAKVIETDKGYKDAQARIEALIAQLLADAQALYDEEDFKGAMKQARAAKGAMALDMTASRKKAEDLIGKCKDALLGQYEALVVITDDTMDDRLFVEPKNMYANPINKNGVRLWLTASIIRIESGAFYRFHVDFTKKDWLFMNRVKLKSGDLALEFNLSYNSVDRDVNRGYIEEDVRIVIEEQDELETLAAMLLSKEPLLIRISGSEGSMDFTVTDRQKMDMLIILDYYHCMVED